MTPPTAGLYTAVMIDVMTLDSEVKVKAFTHPYRMKILRLMVEARKAMTATDVARELGDGPGRVHYHMRTLEAAGIVTLARTETVNGIIARYYEPAARHYSVPDGASGFLSADTVRDDVSRMISRRFRNGMRAFLQMTAGSPGAQDTDGPDIRWAESSAGSPAGSGGVDGPGSNGGMAGDDDAFLLEYSMHCTDEEWKVFRDTLEKMAERYLESRPGTRARHFFVTGATDRSGRTS